MPRTASGDAADWKIRRVGRARSLVAARSGSDSSDQAPEPASSANAGAEAVISTPPAIAGDYLSGIPAPIIDYQPVTNRLNRWTVGTLSYTFGGLATVFVLLLCGDFAYQMRERSVQPVVQVMLRRLHASDTLMAFVFSTLPTILSLLISPVVSYRSDRFRSRWGRRIPFLLIPTPVAAAAMIGIAYTEDFGRGLQHFLSLPNSSHDLCAVQCFAVFWTIFEVAATVAGAVLNGLINDVVPPSVLGRFYGMYRQVSLGAGIIFNWWIIGEAETHYKAIFIGIAILFFLGFSVMCLTVREGQYPPPPTADPTAGPRLWSAIETYFRECFSMQYYRRLFIGLTLAATAFTPINLFQIPYAGQLGVSMHTYGRLLSLSFFISFFLASPLGWVVDKAHALRSSMVTVAIYSILMILFGFSIHDARTFEIALVVHTVMSGCFWTVSASLGQALFPRLTFAQFASAANLVTSLFAILFTIALGRLLDLTHHDYRLTFLIAGGFGVVAVGTLLIVYKDFKRFGGPQAYVAPEQP